MEEFSWEELFLMFCFTIKRNLGNQSASNENITYKYELKYKST